MSSMSSADHAVAQTDAMAAAPGPERLPRLRKVLLEQFRTGPSGDGSRMLLGISLTLVLFALFMGLFRRGLVAAEEGAGVATQVSFFPELGWYVLFWSLMGLALVRPPAPYFSTLPVQRVAHALLRTVGVGVLVITAMALTLVAGGLYAHLVGNLTGYLLEVASYFPVPLIAGIIAYLFAAAVGLAADVYERWWTWAVGGILLAGIVTFLSDRPLPEPLRSIREHLLFVFGGVTPERLSVAGTVEAFPYGAWLPWAMIWLMGATAAVVYSASRYQEEAG